MLIKKTPSIKSAILRRIEESPEHSIFFINDFVELGSMETVRKVLQQARLLGLVSHVAHGIYVKPMQSRFGEVPPPLEKIAKEIAQRDRVEIMPVVRLPIYWGYRHKYRWWCPTLQQGHQEP